ncbi:MAG: HAD-IA family hydrolase [Patescibacteria group bacterium]
MKTILVDAWNTFVTESGVFQEMKDLLDSFYNRKIIVTNANEEEREKFGIVSMPYEVFSLEHNPNKTDPEYFQKLLEHFSLTPNEVVYFEHNTEAVASAQSVGITTFWYDKDAKDLKGLKKFLLENS